MIVIKGPRGSRKTTKLVELSAKKGYPILVSRDSQEKLLLSIAKELEVTIPDPIFANNLPLSFGRDYKGFLVDNIEEVLPILLNTNATLKGISFTEDNS